MKKQFRIINTRKGILNITSADLNEVVGGGTVIVNNTLTSTSITEALSAYQGKVLKDVQDSQQVSINLNTAKVSNVVQTLSNTLDGTSNTTALSSNQGSLKLIPGTNVTFTNTGTSLNRIITINATTSGGGGGTVTRVGALNGTFISSVSSDITGAGDLRYDLSATGTPSINTYLRGDNTWAPTPNVITYNSFTAIVDWTASTALFTVSQLFNNTGKTFAFTAPLNQNDYFITPSSNFADVDKVWLSFTGANYNGNRTYFPAASVNASEVFFFIQESDTGNSIATDWSQLFVEIRIYP